MSKASITNEQIKRISQLVSDSFASDLDPSVKLEQIYGAMDTIILNSEEDALRVYFLIILALETCIPALILKTKDRLKLKDMGEKCLHYCHILPVTSQNSHLYTRLSLALARYQVLEGDTWASITETMVGEYLGRDSKIIAEASVLLRAEQAWRLGHLRTAKIALHTFDSQKASHNPERLEALRLLIRIYRLSGDVEQAESLGFSYQDEFATQDSSKRLLELENFFSRLVKGEDPKELATFLNREQNQLENSSLDNGRLWLFASRYRDIWKSFSKSRSRKSKSVKVSVATEQYVAQLIEVMEELYKQDVPLQNRLKTLGLSLKLGVSGPDPEAGMVFIAASIRWLHRIKQLTFASILSDEYQSLSLKFSEGAKLDTLNLLQDVRENLPVVVDRESVKRQAQLYTGTLPRFLKISQIAAKATYLFAKLHIQSLDKEAFNVRKKQIFQDIFKDLEQAFSDFKGPTMKIGQMLAASCLMNDDSQAIMQRVYDSAEAIPFALMRQGIDQDDPQFFEKNFSYFDAVPFAVASIGQVFRATLHDGTPVAVKIKYPEVEKIVSADMRIARVFMPIFRQFFPKERAEGIFDQFRQRFERECDYLKEAESQSQMGQLVKDHPQLRAPKLYGELSNQHLLVSEFVTGIRLDHYLQTASQEQRNQLALTMMRFFTLSIFRFRLMHIDPHLANFIVDGDDLIILDFGAVIAPLDEAIVTMQNIMVCMYRGDYDNAYDELVKMDVIRPDHMSREEFRTGFGRHLFSPFDQDEVRTPYQDGRGNVLEYVMHARLASTIYPDVRLFFVLSIICVYKDLLTRMQASINWHDALGSLLLEFGFIDEKVAPAQRGA